MQELKHCWDDLSMKVEQEVQRYAAGVPRDVLEIPFGKEQELLHCLIEPFKK